MNQYQEISDWVSKNGLYPVKYTGLTCEEIANIDYKYLQNISLEQFEEILSKFTSYVIYLKSIKSSIEIQVQITSSDLNKRMYIETNNLGPDYKYKNIEEKIAIVRTSNEDIDNLFNSLNILKAKFIKIKDIPYSIEKKIEILKLIYHRRLSDERSIKHQQ